MCALQTPPVTALPPDTPANRAGLLTGWRLAAARGVWIVLVLGAAALYVAAVPARYSQLLTPCAAGMCVPGQAVSGTLPTLGSYAGALVALDIVFALAYIAMALLIFWRRSADGAALFVSLTLVLWGLTFTGTMNALPQVHPAWFLPVASARFLGAALITVFFYVFPDGHFVPGWARWLAFVWVFSQLPKYFRPDSFLNPDLWPAWLYVCVSAGFLAVMVAVQVYRYRWVSHAPQRRQTKWVVLGIALSLTAYLVVLLLGYVTAPQPGSTAYVLYTGTLNATLLLIPLSIGIAVLRDRLYDIDFLINRSLVYGILTGVLVALYAGSVFLLGGLARALTGQQNSSLAIVVSTLGVAAVFQPLRGRIHRGIDRRFFRRRFNAARVLAAFSEVLYREVDMARLSEQLVGVVERTMEPAHISLVLLPPRERSHDRPAEEPGTGGPLHPTPV
ncbi:MAG TPA: hypothetical protein VKT52_12370 [Ktedonobacterales bacterium]|nr:hypothetical protein [Ktedonobacterales bacterium]